MCTPDNPDTPSAPTRAGYMVSRSSYTLTDQDWETILHAISQGHSITVAARLAHAHRQTVYDRMNRDPDFKELVRQVHEEGIDSVEDMVLQNASLPRNFLDRIAWLKAHRPGKWRDDRPQAQTPTINIVINAPSAQQLRDALDGEYRIIAEPDAREALPEPDDAMLYDADSST